MELAMLVGLQIAADRRRRFPVDFTTAEDRLTQIERDTLGLCGEVGEFANALKKVRLGQEDSRYEAQSLEEASFHLREELADAFIYLMRLTFMLDGDLEKDVLKKMSLNDVRYKSLEGK